MENPQIRYIEAFPIQQDGEELILIHDSEGLMEKPLIITRDAAFIISLMDGNHSLRDIQTEYMRTFGQLIYTEQLEQFIEALDKNLLLLNDNYRNVVDKLKREYEQEKVREPFSAGRSYSANRMDLLAFLNEVFKDDGKSELEPDMDITGILAPHIDYSRGIEVYRDVYKHMRGVKKPLIIILGVSHKSSDKIISISLKDFATPLDICKNSQELGALIRNDPLLKEYIDEWPHRIEHSIELQLPLLQFVMEDEFEILPILTGSMHEYILGMKTLPDREITEIAEGLKNLIAQYGKPCIILSGVDLAHIGSQFGDRYPLDALSLAQSKVKDNELLESISHVDAERFFQLIKDEADKRRICGLTAIYLQLLLLKGNKCRITGYKQWFDGKSSVSFAGAVFFK
ncbi:MAG TPA: AmmeMemoRadiSam system protein B [Syntrophorhabdaceae bacterium]|nr:AmmeMemoRadiSam system protein B [Syntrophorhabdaceae bacterium]